MSKKIPTCCNSALKFGYDYALRLIFAQKSCFGYLITQRSTEGAFFTFGNKKIRLTKVKKNHRMSNWYLRLKAQMLRFGRMLQLSVEPCEIKSVLFLKKNYLGESEEKSNSTRWVESIINFVFYSLLASMTIVKILSAICDSICGTGCRTSFIACWFFCPTTTIKICFKISLSVCGGLIPNLQEKFNNQIQLQL